MNNGSSRMKSTSRTASLTDQALKQTSTIDSTDVSILSVGLTRYPQYNRRMLTDDDDEEDIEVRRLACQLIGSSTALSFRTKPATTMRTTTTTMTMMIFALVLFLNRTRRPSQTTTTTTMISTSATSIPTRKRSSPRYSKRPASLIRRFPTTSGATSKSYASSPVA